MMKRAVQFRNRVLDIDFYYLRAFTRVAVMCGAKGEGVATLRLSNFCERQYRCGEPRQLSPGCGFLCGG